MATKDGKSDSSSSSPNDVEMNCGDDAIVTEAPSSYAGAAGSGIHKITFKLESDKRNDFHVTPKEVSRLVYSRLDAPPHSLLAFDDVAYGKLEIWLKSTVDLGSINLTQSLEIREGLRTKPILPPTKEKDVHIYWAPLTLNNTAIEKVLLTFGQMVGTVGNIGVKNKVYRAKEDDDDVTRMMDGVVLTDRICKMIINHPIPSHILVEGIKLKVIYEGQSRTCGNCYKFWSNCPGNGKVDICRAKMEAANKAKKEKGEKATKAPSMKANWNKLTKKMEEKMKKGMNANLLNGDFEAGKPRPPTCLRLSSLPTDVTLPELYNVFKANNCEIENMDDKISIDGVPGTATIRELDEIDYQLVTEQLDGVYLRGKRIKVTPIQESTPEKSEAPPASPSAPPASPAPAPSAPAGQRKPASGQPPAKVSPPPVNSKDDTENVLRTPPTQSTVQQIANWFTNRTAAASKTYERVTDSGKKFQSRKTLRLSSDEEISPRSDRVQTRRSKRSKDSSFKHSSK